MAMTARARAWQAVYCRRAVRLYADMRPMRDERMTGAVPSASAPYRMTTTAERINSGRSLRDAILPRICTAASNKDMCDPDTDRIWIRPVILKLSSSAGGSSS